MSTFVGFGFGAIQGGLFLAEAFSSQSFSRLVVSEIDPELVNHMRRGGGTYFSNVAGSTRLRNIQVEGIEIYNPLVAEDREQLIDAIAEAQELCTALPSFKLYDIGEEASVAKLISEGLRRKIDSSKLPSCVIYAAENDSRAASRLQDACSSYLPDSQQNRFVFSETVIAKMCSVVTDQDRIQSEGLRPIVDGLNRAFLVEEFNQILIEEKIPSDFNRGFNQFVTKSELDPFAITKFLGHNAIHALLGYLAKEEGIDFMHDAGKRSDLIEWARSAFLKEAGIGLCHQYASVDDPLFSESGFQEYVDDALTRMINPFLRDPVDRVTRDPVRKIGWDDRLLGSMRLACKAGVEPCLLAKGAGIALRYACEENNWDSPEAGLEQVWKEVQFEEKNELQKLIIANF